MSGGYKLFVGHLPYGARTKDLEHFFKDHGFSRSVIEVVVKTGYGFVIFDDRRDADDAIFELNGKELLNSRLQVEYAKPSGRSEDRGGSGGGRNGRGGGYGRDGDRSDGGKGGRGGYGRPYNTEFRLIIENLSTRCSWQYIKDHFRQAGEVTFAKCHREKEGEGVVEFASQRDMDSAMKKLNGTELFGRKIRLRSDNKDPAARSRSRSRTRSRSPKRHSPVRASPGGRGQSRSRSPPTKRTFSRSPRHSITHSPSPR